MTNMNTNSLASDIATLRSRGVSDDEILSSYRSYAPEDAEDIDRLLGEGRTAREMVDGLTTYQGRPPPESPDSSLEVTRKALQYGAANAAVGIGRTAHWLGEASGIDAAKDIGKAVSDFGQGMAPENYRPASGDFMHPHARDKGVGGFGWSYLPRTVLEGAPGLVADIGAGALAGPGGFLASNASRSFGPAMDARVENNGGKEATATDYAIAAGASALQAGLNRVGLNPALTNVTKGAGLGAIAQIPAQVAKAGAADAVAGVAGSVIDQAGVSAGTDKGLSIDPHEALGAGAASGATAGGLRTLRGVGDVVNAVRYSDFDPVVAQRLAGRFDKLNIDPESPEGAYKAMHIAEAVLNSDIGRTRKDFRFSVGKENADKAAPAMGTAEASLREGAVLTSKNIDDIRDAVGDSAIGQRYLEAIEDHSALNDLKTKGRYENDYFAGGVSSSPAAENIINPASWLRSPTKAAIGSTAALIGFGSDLAAAQALLAPATLAQNLVLQGATYGTLRASDWITGSRNPFQEFRGRFGGAPKSDAAPQGRSLTGPERSQLQDAVRDAVAPPSKAVSPMERVLSDAETSQVLEAVRKAAGEPVEAQGRPSMGMGSPEGPEAAGGASRASYTSINPATIRIEVDGYAVERPRAGIDNEKAYVSKTRQHMQARAKFGDELAGAVGAKHSAAVRGLVEKLNRQARTSEEAAFMVEDAINDLPWALRSPAWDAYLKHEPDLRATYRQR